MRGRGTFPLPQMRRRNAKVIELCRHLRAAVDLLECLAAEPVEPEPQPTPTSNQAPTVKIAEGDNLAFSVREASKPLGIGRTTLYVAMNEGKNPAVKFGKRTLLPAQGLRDWFNSLPSRRAEDAQIDQ